MFLEILQNSQENLCAGVSFLIKLQAWGLLKDRLWHRCFPVNFAKFLRTSFLTEHLWWLLLNCIKKNSRIDKENYFQTSQNILEQIKIITDQSEYSRADKEIMDQSEYCHIYQRSMKDWSKNNSESFELISSKYQSGFRKGHNTQQCLFVVIENWKCFDKILRNFSFSENFANVISEWTHLNLIFIAKSFAMKINVISMSYQCQKVC